MTLSTCSKCGTTFVTLGERYNHQCPPEWKIWCPEYDETEEDAKTIYAGWARDAAAKWGEWFDREDCDYTILNGDDVVVHVKGGEFNTVRQFRVQGKTVPEYWAEEL